MTPTTMGAGIRRAPDTRLRHYGPRAAWAGTLTIVVASITGVARQSRPKPTAGAAVTYRDLKMNANRRGQ
jgi:hypothetical protein